MSLPNTFGSLTSATGAMLDANFAALGALTAVACTAAGSNAVTLTPQVNTPAVSAYANYMPFSFVIAASNTGATTLRIGSLAALPVYQDTATGPAVLSGGELVAGNAAYVVYDGALNGGSGGWHLSISSAAIKEPCYPVTGSSTRLIGYAPGGGSVASWSAGEFIATNPATGASVKALPLSTVSFNGLTSGANGMDTGAMPTSGQLAVYAIYNPVTLTWAALGQAVGNSVTASLTYSGANAPAGYTYSALLWVGVTDGSAHIVAFNQRGNRVYVGPTSVLSGTAGGANTYASLSTAVVVPFTAYAVWGVAGVSGTGTGQVAIAATSGGSLVQYVTGGASGTALDTFTLSGHWDDIVFATAQILYWKSGTTTETVGILIGGYSF